MRILSLFDGISCARVALLKQNFKIEKYFASEIDKYAVQVAQKNYPDTIQLGDVKEIGKKVVSKIDLLIGGSPCQDLSIAKKNREGLKGSRSGLFYEYVRILKEIKPKYFLLENVARMSEESKNIITETLGVQPVLFNASLVSAQDRPRLFWTNINFELPENMGIVLKDILIADIPRRWLEIKQPLQKTKKGVRWDTSGRGYFSQQNRAYGIEGKSPTVPTCRTVTKTKIFQDGKIGELHIEEIERLQGLPDRYTEGIVNKEIRGGLIGN